MWARLELVTTHLGRRQVCSGQESVHDAGFPWLSGNWPLLFGESTPDKTSSGSTSATGKIYGISDSDLGLKSYFFSSLYLPVLCQALRGVLETVIQGNQSSPLPSPAPLKGISNLVGEVGVESSMNGLGNYV